MLYFCQRYIRKIYRLSNMTDNIAAIATANGTGGVAIIRISGKTALETAKKMFSPTGKACAFKPN